MGAAALLTGRNKQQVTFGAAGAGAETAGTGTVSPSYPAGITAGMILLLQAFVRDSAVSPTVTTPAGWTAIANTGASGAGTSREYAFWKVADGTESGALAVTYSGDTYGMARLYRCSVGTTVEAGSGTRTAASATNVDCVNVTTTSNLEMAVQFFAAHGASTTIGDASGESGADYTEAVAEYVGASGFGILQLQTAAVTTPTAITGGSATLGAARTDRCRIGCAVLP